LKRCFGNLKIRHQPLAISSSSILSEPTGPGFLPATFLFIDMRRHELMKKPMTMMIVPAQSTLM
jgi:hypothetical protein